MHNIMIRYRFYRPSHYRVIKLYILPQNKLLYTFNVQTEQHKRNLLLFVAGYWAIC